MITKVKTSGGEFGSPVTVDLANVYKKLCSGDYAKLVNTLSLLMTEASLEDSPKGEVRGIDNLPYLLFSATFGRRSLEDPRSFSRLVLLSVSCPEGLGRISQLKDRVTQLPYTLLAFTGCSRKTLKIVVECRYGDGSEPQSAEEYETFLREAGQTAARLYQAMAGCEAVPMTGSLLQGCRMSSDERAVYKVDAQPVTVIREKTSEAMSVQLESTGAVSNMPEKDADEQLKMEYYACLDKARESAVNAEELVQALAFYCRKAHLPEEMCVRETMLKWSTIPVSDDLKRRIFRSVYKEVKTGEKPISQMNEKERVARFIRDFFDRRYQLRYNEVKQVEEFRPRGMEGALWNPLTHRELKRIAFEEMLEGGYGWSIDIETYVQSSIIKPYNPIREFLDAAKKYYDPGHDYIGELARRVPCGYGDWPKYFHRWFLAMVAQWLGRGGHFGNAVVPMLIGQQGTHKTTFCRMLMPLSLREYYMDDIKMDNAEQVERVLGRMALVNIDEYNAKTDREQAKIKRLLTETSVQVRRMRSDQYTLTQRLCSFIATTNDRQPLPAGDGTRRFLCVEVMGVIDTDTPIDYRRLYAQAINELDKGLPFRFYPQEETEIQEHNRAYQQHTSAEEAVSAFFEPAPKDAKYHMQATEIQDELKKRLKASDVPNLKMLTVTLRQNGFLYGSVNSRRGWFVKLREDKM